MRVAPRGDGYEGDDYWSPEPLVPDLIAADAIAVRTGLLDANGNPIRRAPRPMGFGCQLDRPIYIVEPRFG